MDELHCACLIHGNLYNWTYVDRLYNMLTRNSSKSIVLHVFTEHSRAVPTCYIKHTLEDWNIKYPGKTWWYKMQMFNPEFYSGPLLYFDLDTVIVDNIDWLCNLSTDCFWGIRDFKCLWKPMHQGINSSIMWWNTDKFSWIYDNFKQLDFNNVLLKYHGDQDFITDQVPIKFLRFFPGDRLKSWRWQAFDGGYDFSKKTWKKPGTGTNIHNTSVLIFHGNPKPHEVSDEVIAKHWQ